MLIKIIISDKYAGFKFYNKTYLTSHKGTWNMTLHQHKQKHCPSCNAVFECKAETITECQCHSITMDERERNYIAQYYQDCLCAACLVKMKAACTNEVVN